MKRRLSLVACGACGIVAAAIGAGQPRPFGIVEATIAGMQSAMAERRVTSRELVSQS